jgi:uncharacterized membrane protein YecN with MAPEG domain
MEFNQVTTYGIFAAVVVAAVAALLVTEMMPPQIIFMMVAPSILVFGGLCLFLGIKHGEYRGRGV